MHRRSQTQQVHHHHFTIVIPAIRKKASLRSPAVWQQRCVFGKPGPIDAVVDAVREVGDFGMLEKCSRQVKTPHSKMAVSIEETSDSHNRSPVLMFAQR